MRLTVFFLMVAFAIWIVAPSVRAIWIQHGELEALAEEAAQARAERDALVIEAARWDDDAFVEAQARERLKFTFPGETAYMVLDPETVTGPAVQPDAK